MIKLFNYIEDDCLEVESKLFLFKLYGSIYNKGNIDDVTGAHDISAIKRSLSNLSGYFFLIVFDKKSNEIHLFNDIFGNYRVYYTLSDGNVYISNSYIKLHGLFEHNPCNTHEMKYFEGKRYTTGFSTLNQNVHKVWPAANFKIGHSFDRGIYFEKQNVQTDKHYERANYELIKQNIVDNIDPSLTTLLFFSGGVDSTYLALLLKEQEIPFTAVFIEYTPEESDNFVDKSKVLSVCKALNIQLEIIKLDIEKQFEKYQDIAFQQHPMDKAFSISLYYACDFLKKKYGMCNIINGQSSDSIYCWSSSGKSLGAFLQRYLTLPYYIKSIYPIRKLTSSIIGYLYKRRWGLNSSYRIPTSEESYWLALLDPIGYLPITSTDTEHLDYYQYLNEEASHILSLLGNKPELLTFYTKFLYLQGTSNMPVIKSSEYYNHKMIMPFLDARIVQLKMKYQNELKNLFFPRYVLENFMEDNFTFDISIIDGAKKVKHPTGDFSSFISLTRKIYSRWDMKIKKDLSLRNG